jgi:hypothetical protein
VSLENDWADPAGVIIRHTTALQDDGCIWVPGFWQSINYVSGKVQDGCNGRFGTLIADGRRWLWSPVIARLSHTCTDSQLSNSHSTVAMLSYSPRRIVDGRHGPRSCAAHESRILVEPRIIFSRDHSTLLYSTRSHWFSTRPSVCVTGGPHGSRLSGGGKFAQQPSETVAEDFPMAVTARQLRIRAGQSRSPTTTTSDICTATIICDGGDR